ncbi:hypothetical protein SAV14893_097670 [Streptomyces avermitilis]|uniref:Uncharacterized protein n=1 Tax=Streptomyces avermitilis TaxID=33903 RepID=A0A4D4MF09_STRAX|nr:hypothetical protein SAV14893_097670 [Streptomyces avermitilis]
MAMLIDLPGGGLGTRLPGPLAASGWAAGHRPTLKEFDDQAGPDHHGHGDRIRLERVMVAIGQVAAIATLAPALGLTVHQIALAARQQTAPASGHRVAAVPDKEGSAP